MTEDEGTRILRKLEARFGMNPRLFWSAAVAESYAEVLAPHEYNRAMEVVTAALRALPDTAPTDAQLEAMLGSPRSVETGDREPYVEPVYDAMSQFKAFREGYENSYRKRHPGQEIPSQLRREFDGMEKKIQPGGALVFRGVPMGMEPRTVDPKEARK